MLSTVEWKYLEYISYPSKLIKLFFILSVLAGVFLTNGNLAISKKNIVLCIKHRNHRTFLTSKLRITYNYIFVNNILRHKVFTI